MSYKLPISALRWLAWIALVAGVLVAASALFTGVRVSSAAALLAYVLSALFIAAVIWAVLLALAAIAEMLVTLTQRQD